MGTSIQKYKCAAAAARPADTIFAAAGVLAAGKHYAWRGCTLQDVRVQTLLVCHRLEEEDYRGERYANHHKELKGNNDLLVITKPQVGCCPTRPSACSAK